MKDKLNILIISTACAPTVTDGTAQYGGIETLVGTFAEELLKQGNDVSVASPVGSKFSEGIQHIPTVTLPQQVWDERFTYQKLSSNLLIPNGFDIIHDFSHNHVAGRISHGCWANEYPFLFMVWHPPYFHGMPNRISEPAYNLCAISKHQAYGLQKVYNQKLEYGYLGIDTEKYALEKNKGDRYLWISVPNREKGGLEAIKICKDLGLKLDCVGGQIPGQSQDYVESMRSQCDGDQIKWIGGIPETVKIEYMQKAKGMIFPVTQAEPFGLVVSESLSCGTPVFAFNQGAVPEQMVEDKFSYGVVGNTLDQLKAGLQAYESGKECVYDVNNFTTYNIEQNTTINQNKILQSVFNPERCRNRVVTKFSKEVMIETYGRIYQKIIDRKYWY